MAAHNTSSHSSLTSLTDEIHGIYQSYALKGTSESPRHSLDSAENESALNLHSGSLLAPPSLASNLEQSGTETPQSTSSFDFTAHDNVHQVTNSSLNVLLDSTYDIKGELVSSVSLVDSKQSLNPSALETSQPSVTKDSLESEASYKNYDENLNESDWVERGAATASVSTPTSTTVIRRTVEDFEFGKDLGEGSYSTVVLAKDKVTGFSYAVKILDKRHIIKEKKVKYVNIEKHALNRLNNTQGIISLFFTFQDQNSLYFVLDYASNGELLGLIKKYGTLNEASTRHLAAQILDAIKHMHINGVIHRDIKPENILLDDKCRIRITDFGTAKLLERKKNGNTGAEEDYPLDVRAKSFVGTAEYVSPELLENKYCGKPGDLWAFGCILYQMIAGKPPFKATNEYLTFQKITKLQYAFSAGFPSILRDLIKQILVLQPSRRATIDQIQDHYFFRDCNFDDADSIWNGELPELGPYKMTAQSMMKMPKTLNHKRSVVKKITRRTEVQDGIKSKTRNTASKNDSKNYSAASVAAYVLNKEEHVPDTTSKAPKSPKASSEARKSANLVYSTADYIPGTNILRPQINKMSNYSISSSASSRSIKGSLKGETSKVLEVGPPTALEAAWQQHLSTSERVLNVGSATVKRLPTEVFEKKNKGYVHNAPLDMTYRFQNSNARGSSQSMLSHVVQDQMRGDQEPLTRIKTHVEEDAIAYHKQEVIVETTSTKGEDEEDKHISVATNSARLGRSLFKKLLPSNAKKDDTSKSQSGSGSSESVEKRMGSLMDKVRSYTVVVTTFGRVLLFTKDNHKTDFELICEIFLDFPFVQLKEVVSSSNIKFSRMIPSTGIFAIVVSKTTFVFKTEKYEVAQWIEALAKSKLNQSERQREAKQKQHAKERSISSPKSLDSPVFSSPIQRQSPKLGSTTEFRDPQQQQHRPSESQLHDSKDSRISNKSHRLLQSKISSRKAPPPISTSSALGTSGLIRGHNKTGSETIHAAQLAVLNSPTISSMEKNSPGGGHISASSPTGAAKITSVNSKFLARTRGKK